MFANFFSSKRVSGLNFCKSSIDLRQSLRREKMLQVWLLGIEAFNQILAHYLRHVFVNAGETRLGGALLGFLKQTIIQLNVHANNLTSF